jgi:hypothetical protein
MITKRRYKQIQETYLSMAVLFAAGIFSIITLSNAPQIHALEGTSTQTSCSEGQPCKASETPNTDFDADENTLTPPSEDETIQQPLEGTGTMGQAPSPDAYNNDYREDQEEERQDMIEDAEYD